MPRFWKLMFIILLLTAAVIWIAVFSTAREVKIISCNVGQGDATLIIYKNIDILIDGGPDNRVLQCLSEHLPFWDRTIEVVILTHPQKDHFFGLIGVFERYNVKKFLANSLSNSSQMYSLLKNQVLDEGTHVVNPVAGMAVRSKLIQLDILHPSEEFLSENSLLSTNYQLPTTPQGVLGASTSSLDPNEFSIVTMLSFGSFRFLFTGDAGSDILDDLATTEGALSNKPLNYIKIPHHGSRNSISEKMYELAENAFAAISVGKNSYGHPSQETLEKLREHHFQIFRTDEVGDVVVVTDGKKVWVEE